MGGQGSRPYLECGREAAAFTVEALSFKRTLATNFNPQNAVAPPPHSKWTAFGTWSVAGRSPQCRKIGWLSLARTNAIPASLELVLHIQSWDSRFFGANPRID